MPVPAPQSERERVFDLVREVGVTEAARRSGWNRYTIRGWCQVAGVDTSIHGGRRGEAERERRRVEAEREREKERRAAERQAGDVAERREAKVERREAKAERVKRGGRWVWRRPLSPEQLERNHAALQRLRARGFHC